MEEVIKIFKQIQNTSSTNDKKAIIEANKDNELFKKCLVFLLDSNIVTGISDKKLNKFVGMSGTELNSFEEVMKYLADFNSGSDMDIGTMQGFIENQPEEYQDFYKQMITKKFRLGCDKKVVNSVIHGLIPSWDVQQAYPISEKNEPKDGEWFALSQKLNGNNCAYYKGKLISRQGKPFTGLDHIIKDIERLPKHENYMFNGELIRKNYDNLSDNDNFQIGTGIINSDDSDKSYINTFIFTITHLITVRFKIIHSNDNLRQFVVCRFLFLYSTPSQHKTASQKNCHNTNSFPIGMGIILSIFSHIHFLFILIFMSINNSRMQLHDIPLSCHIVKLSYYSIHDLSCP